MDMNRCKLALTVLATMMLHIFIVLAYAANEQLAAGFIGCILALVIGAGIWLILRFFAQIPVGLKCFFGAFLCVYALGTFVTIAEDDHHILLVNGELQEEDVRLVIPFVTDVKAIPSKMRVTVYDTRAESKEGVAIGAAKLTATATLLSPTRTLLEDTEVWQPTLEAALTKELVKQFTEFAAIRPLNSIRLNWMGEERILKTEVSHGPMKWSVEGYAKNIHVVYHAPSATE